MWAQYADGHRGIVVEFETEEDPHFFKEMGKVNYVACPPIYSDRMKVSDVIYSKSLDSDKELEWRVFGKHGLKDIKSQAIKSIIFGYRFPRGISVSTDIPEEMNEVFPQEKIEAFREIDRFFWENQLPETIDFYHTIIEHGQYKLTISSKFAKPVNGRP